MRARRQMDGGRFTVRDNDPAVKELAAKYKFEDGAWYPRTENSIFDLHAAHEGKILQIVGKGPSLDTLTINGFLVGQPVLALNDSIAKLDAISPDLATYVMQCDGNLQESCRPVSAKLLLGMGSRGYYESYQNRYIFDTQSLFNVGADISAAHAMRLAKFFGCIGVRMLAFDSVAGEMGYAKIIRPGRSPDSRFQTHRPHLERLAKELALKLEWVPTWNPKWQAQHAKSAETLLPGLPQVDQ